MLIYLVNSYEELETLPKVVKAFDSFDKAYDYANGDLRKKYERIYDRFYSKCEEPDVFEIRDLSKYCKKRGYGDIYEATYYNYDIKTGLTKTELLYRVNISILEVE